MKGKLTEIEVQESATGKSSKGPWTLFRRKLIVDGEDFGLAEFDESKLKAKLNELNPLPCFVEFETEKKGKYINIKFDSLKKIEEKDMQTQETKEQCVSESFSGSNGKLDSAERALTLAVELTGKFFEYSLASNKPMVKADLLTVPLELAREFENFLNKKK